MESPEIAAKRKRVSEAMRALEDKHFAWMVDALREHFRKEAERSELAIARHVACAEEPIVARTFERREPKTRAARIAEAKGWLAQYRAIQFFIEELSELVSQASAERFAKEVAASFFRTPRGRQ